MLTLIVVVGYLVVTATICGVLAAMVGHIYLWHRMPGTGSALGGGMICAGMVFGMLWVLNPDPPRENARPTVGATAVMTAFSGFLWWPVYMTAFGAISRRRQR